MFSAELCIFNRSFLGCWAPYDFRLGQRRYVVSWASSQSARRYPSQITRSAPHSCLLWLPNVEERRSLAFGLVVSLCQSAPGFSKETCGSHLPFPVIRKFKVPGIGLTVNNLLRQCRARQERMRTFSYFHSVLAGCAYGLRNVSFPRNGKQINWHLLSVSTIKTRLLISQILI